MKISENFILKDIAGTFIVVPCGSAMVDLNGMLTLNETGAFLFEKLKEECSKEELIEKMRAEFDVDLETATADIDEFINKLKEIKVLEG